MGFGGDVGGGSAPATPIEPVKSAEEVMKSASDSSARAAQLRRGIASTFNRPTVDAAGTSATSGTGTKLGS